MSDPLPPVPGKRLPGGIPVRALIPNVITVLALCAGLTGVRFALAGKWEEAALAVVIAGVLDGLDGRIARMLRGTSRFGAELDSLADVIAFGVAPAIIIYQWALNDIKFGWVIALAHVVCCALRLARFNANLDVDDQPHERHGFNMGVPSPAGAGLTLSPLFAGLWLDREIFQSAWIAAPVVAATAMLMVSPFATFSWKSFHIPPHWRVPAIAVVVLLLALLFDPDARWIALSLVAFTYAVSIGFSITLFHQRVAADVLPAAAVTDPPLSDEAIAPAPPAVPDGPAIPDEALPAVQPPEAPPEGQLPLPKP
jgi:CDP-diacylglycerol---serine O-phosphatidyltransferase